MTSALRRAAAAVLALLLGASAPGARAAEPATVTVAKIKDLNIRIYGFLETNFIVDSREGFAEAQGNTPVPRSTLASGADNFAGRHGRTQLSVRTAASAWT